MIMQKLTISNLESILFNLNRKAVKITHTKDDETNTKEYEDFMFLSSHKWGRRFYFGDTGAEGIDWTLNTDKIDHINITGEEITVTMTDSSQIKIN